jgi:esterase
VPDVLANGVRLHVEQHGAGDPILLIHGTSSSAMVWQPSAIAALSKLGRLIVYDRRGCTRSERPHPYETNVRQHAGDAAGLLEAFDAIPAVVIGRSYGGETAAELAIRHPGHVRALALLEAAALSLDAEAFAWAEGLKRRVEEAAELDHSSVAETFLRVVLGDRQWESFKPEAKEMFVENSPAILAEFRGGMLQANQADLAKISVPTLLVASEGSPPAFRRVTERMAAAIPNSRTVLVGGDHLIDPGQPDVLEFVGKILG